MLRPLEFIERDFVTPGSSEFVQLAIKFTDSSLVPKVVDNFKKIFYGQRLKVLDKTYYKTTGTFIARLPTPINDCKEACKWIFENHRRPVSETLTTIAANDNIVVVNSNHTAADSSFLIRAMDHCLDEDVCPLAEVPYVMSKAYKKQLDKAKASNVKLYPYHDCTHFTYDPKDPELTKKGTGVSYIQDEFPVEKLVCYDSKKKRPINLSAVEFSSISLACSAFNEKLPNNFALPFVIDLKRFLEDPSKVDWSYNNHVCSTNLFYNIQPNITLNDANKLFTKSLKEQELDGSYYASTQAPYHFIENNNIYGNLSNIGPIKFKKPVADFYIKSTNDGVGVDNQVCIITYSKVNETSNILTNQLRYTTSTVTHKAANIFYDSYKYILTTIPLDTKLSEAFKAVKEFQTKLNKHY